MARRPHSVKVWFHRSRAILWAILGLVSFPLGWANSVALVWAASVYANVAGDLGVAEAADDRQILERLDRIETLLAEIAGKSASGH